MDKQNYGRNVLIVASLTVLSKLIAVIRQIVLTYYFGATNISDAYILAQTIPNSLFLLVSSAIGVSFIPVFNKVKQDKGNDEAELFTSRIIKAVIFIASAIVLLTLIFSRQIIFVFASGFEQETATLSAKYLRISIFSVYFIGMCGVLSSYLKIKGNYFSPSLTGIILSFVEIATCIIAYYFSDIFLAIGLSLAAISQFLILLVSSVKKGFRFHISASIRDDSLKHSIVMALPIMIGLGVDEINVIVDRTIASGFQEGSISVLNYANTLVTIAHNIITVSIYTVLFTDVSALAAKNNKALIGEKITNALNTSLLFLFPATMGMIIFSYPIVKVLYERGNFTTNTTYLTSIAMVFYSLYLVPNGIRMISQAYFYAYGKTRFCMAVSFISVAVNIILNIILSRIMGIYGLALATSIGVAVGAIILFIKLSKEGLKLSTRIMIKKVAIILLNTIVMAASSYTLYLYLVEKINIIFCLLICIIIAISIYLVLSIITKVIDKQVILHFFRK